MTAAHAFLLFAASAFALALNAWWPVRRWLGLNFASFFAGWLTGELVLQQLVWLITVTLGFGLLGGWRGWLGALGLALTAGALIALGLLIKQARAAAGAVQQALAGSRIRAELPLPRIFEKRLWMPFARRPREIHFEGEVPFDLEHALCLDVYSLPAAERVRSPQPALVFVHGGAWVIGARRQQGLPLLWRFARAGWVCFSVEYRLSPKAELPAALIDVKRAVAWIKENAARYGVDPARVVIAGCSAGGHLATLAALTPNAPEWQPGFATANTRVAACLSFYGIYDLTNRHRHWVNPGLRLLLRLWVIKKSLAEARALYEKLSPINHVSADAPAFYVVHGENDSLVPIEDARRFVAALRRAAGAPVVFAAITGAQHGFDLFASLRATPVVEGALIFADAVVSASRAAAGVTGDRAR